MDSQQKMRLKNQMHYQPLLNMLNFRFSSMILIFTIISFGIILSLNGLYNLSSWQSKIPSLSLTQNRLQSLFTQLQSQSTYIPLFFSKIIQKQVAFYKESFAQFYTVKFNQTNEIKQDLYMSNFNTNGEYQCLNEAPCTAIYMLLDVLLAKIIYYKSIQVIYIQYYDPFDHQQTIAVMPYDSNTLSNDSIAQMFVQKYSINSTNSPNSLNSTSLNLIQVDDDLYVTKSHLLNLSFNSSYRIDIALKLRQEEFEQNLKNQVQMKSLYKYQISDNMNWLYLSNESPLPAFTTSLNSITQSLEIHNLITFSIRTCMFTSTFQYFRFLLLLPILFFIVQIIYQRQIVKYALYRWFKNTSRLISLYQFNINQIFIGNKPKSSIILGDTSSRQFFQELSQIPASDYQPIKHVIKSKQKEQQFKFKDVIKRITDKYNNYSRVIFKQKNKQIVNNKFFIHSSVNELSQSESTKLKQHFLRSKQLGLTQHFFKFAYLSLLLSPQQLSQLIKSDKSLLPSQTILLIRQINITVSGSQIRKSFLLSPNVLLQTIEQLQMRIQINLLQKYMQSLKDLDLDSYWLKDLELEMDVQNLLDYIQNIKHLMNKHNKNIRIMGK